MARIYQEISQKRNFHKIREHVSRILYVGKRRGFACRNRRRGFVPVRTPSGRDASLESVLSSELVCDLHHRVADHLVADLEALLEHLGNHVLAQVFILHMHHSVVEVGVERRAG